MERVRPKIAFFLPDLFGGGAERVVVTLCKFLPAERIDANLVLADARGPLLSELPDNIPVINLSRTMRLPTRLGLAVTALSGLVGYLRAKRPAVLISSLTGANLVALLARGIAKGESRCILREANTVANFRNATTRRLARWLYPGADHIIAVSNGVARDLIDHLGIPAEKISVIYNPVDIDDVRRRAAEPLSHPWFGSGQPPVILGVGRLVPQKDFSTLLSAFAKLRQRRAGRLVVLGEGPLRARLHNEARALEIADDVDFPGFVANPFSYMKRAALLALSSRWEGLPNVLIQALAVGLPAVATDCRSGPAEILDNGRYGRLVPVADAEGLANAMLDTLDAPEKRSVLTARADMFHPRTIVTAYLETFYRTLR